MCAENVSSKIQPWRFKFAYTLKRKTCERRLRLNWKGEKTNKNFHSLRFYQEHAVEEDEPD